MVGNEVLEHHIQYDVRLEVHTAVLLQTLTFWDVTLLRLVNRYRHLEGLLCLSEDLDIHHVEQIRISIMVSLINVVYYCN